MRFAILAFLFCSLAHAQLNTNIMHEDESDNGKVAIGTLRYEASQEKSALQHDVSVAPAAWAGFDSKSSSAGGSYHAAPAGNKSGSVAAFPPATGQTDEQRQREEEAARQAAEAAAKQAAAERIAAANNQAAIQQAIADANRRANQIYQQQLAQTQPQQPTQHRQSPVIAGFLGMFGCLRTSPGLAQCVRNAGNRAPTATQPAGAQYQTQFGQPGANYQQAVQQQPGYPAQQSIQQQQRVQQQIVQQNQQTIIQNVVTSIPRF